VPVEDTAFADRRKLFNCVILMRWKPETKDNYVTEFYLEVCRRHFQAVISREQREVLDIGYANAALPEGKSSDAVKGNLLMRSRESQRLKEVKGNGNQGSVQ
jgi:hypothetical protein